MIFLIIVLIISASPHNPGVCTIILTLASLVLIGVTLPFSLVFCLKVNIVRIENLLANSSAVWWHYRIFRLSRNMRELSFSGWGDFGKGVVRSSNVVSTKVMCLVSHFISSLLEILKTMMIVWIVSSFFCFSIFCARDLVSSLSFHAPTLSGLSNGSEHIYIRKRSGIME